MTGLEDYKITWGIDENYKGEIKSEGEVLSELLRIIEQIEKELEEKKKLIERNF